MTLSIFFPKKKLHTAVQNKSPESKYISENFTKRIFPKRKLNISSCRFPRNPTRNIPPASHICAKISLLDSREVLEYFSMSVRKIIPQIAEIIPNK